PVLRRWPGPDFRSRDPALARRPDDLGQCGYGVRSMQFAQGRPTHKPLGNAPEEPSASPYGKRTAQQWAQVPAQLSARVLGGLSLLGFDPGALVAPEEESQCGNLATEPLFPFSTLRSMAVLRSVRRSFAR